MDKNFRVGADSMKNAIKVIMSMTEDEHRKWITKVEHGQIDKILEVYLSEEIIEIARNFIDNNSLIPGTEVFVKEHDGVKSFIGILLEEPNKISDSDRFVKVLKSRSKVVTVSVDKLRRTGRRYDFDSIFGRCVVLEDNGSCQNCNRKLECRISPMYDSAVESITVMGTEEPRKVMDLDSYLRRE